MGRSYERIFTGILMGLVGVLTSIDIIEDFQDGTNLRHLGLDLTVAAVALLAVVYLIVRVSKERASNRLLQQQKLILKQIADNYQKKSKIFIEGLSVHIEQEFAQWKLSDAEKEIALFLLKGLSPLEISKLRKSSDKTVRHQVAAIYRKAGLKGRQELQAYFLEDLLAPQIVK